MRGLYKRGSFWWIQSHGRRVSTKCTDEKAASIVAARIQLRLEIVAELKRDPELLEEIEALLKLRATKIGWVYVLRSGDAVKIGWTGRAVESRLAAARTYISGDVFIYASLRGTRLDERVLHKRFAHARLRGEWFIAADPQVAEWLISVQPQAAE